MRRIFGNTTEENTLRDFSPDSGLTLLSTRIWKNADAVETWLTATRDENNTWRVERYTQYPKGHARLVAAYRDSEFRVEKTILGEGKNFEAAIAACHMFELDKKKDHETPDEKVPGTYYLSILTQLGLLFDAYQHRLAFPGVTAVGETVLLNEQAIQRPGDAAIVLKPVAKPPGPLPKIDDIKSAAAGGKGGEKLASLARRHYVLPHQKAFFAKQLAELMSKAGGDVNKALALVLEDPSGYGLPRLKDRNVTPMLVHLAKAGGRIPNGTPFKNIYEKSFFDSEIEAVCFAGARPVIADLIAMASKDHASRLETTRRYVPEDHYKNLFSKNIHYGAHFLYSVLTQLGPKEALAWLKLGAPALYLDNKTDNFSPAPLVIAARAGHKTFVETAVEQLCRGSRSHENLQAAFEIAAQDAMIAGQESISSYLRHVGSNIENYAPRPVATSVATQAAPQP